MDPQELYGVSDEESEGEWESCSDSDDEIPEKGWYVKNYGHFMLRDIVLHKILGTTRESKPKKKKRVYNAKSQGYEILWDFFNEFFGELDIKPEEGVDAEDKNPEKLQEDLDDYLEERRRIDLAIKTKLSTKKMKSLDITSDIVDFKHKLDGVDVRLNDRLRNIWGIDITDFITLPSNFDYNGILCGFQTVTEVLGIIEKQICKLDKHMGVKGNRIELLKRFDDCVKNCKFDERFNEKMGDKTNQEVDNTLDLDEIEEEVKILRKVLITLQFLGPFIKEIERMNDVIMDLKEVISIDDILTTRKSMLEKSRRKPLKHINLGNSSGLVPIPMNVRRNPLALQGGSKEEEETEHPSGAEFTPVNEREKAIPFVEKS